MAQKRTEEEKAELANLIVKLIIAQAIADYPNFIRRGGARE